MSDKNFDEASYQIYEAVEQIQQANEAGKVATAVAAHHRDSRFKEAKSVAERELRWVDQQQSTLTAVQSRGRDTLGAVGIKFPAYTGQTADGTLTVTFREGLEMAVTDAQVAEKCLRAGVLDLEHLQSRQATIAGGVILAIVAIILLVLLGPRLFGPVAATRTQARRSEAVATFEAEFEAEIGKERTLSLPSRMEIVQVFVPGGTFAMGSDYGKANETPVHYVTLESFWIDQTEVTNAQYAECVAAGVCERSEYADDPEFNGPDYPAVGVNWYDAKAYCEWAGGRLPTEAEWEYAARGPRGRFYPWGNASPTCTLAQFAECNGATIPVGSLVAGESWVGAQDMAGNVWEWVNDWYDADYYRNSPERNPHGPSSGEAKVLRGGSWSSNAQSVRSAFRLNVDPSNSNYNNYGFRCTQE